MPDRGKRVGVTTLTSFNPQPFRFYHPGDSPQKDCPRDASFGHQPSPHRLQRGQDNNWHGRDQRLLPPRSPSPSQDHGFESNWSSVLTASLVSSQSDGCEGCHHIPELEMGLDGIPSCGMPGLYPPSIHHLVLARVPQKTSAKFGDGYNLRQCAYHTRQTL